MHAAEAKQHRNRTRTAALFVGSPSMESAMNYRNKLAVSSVALSAFLIASPCAVMAQGRVDANGMPTDHSTPAEHAATADLNNRISGANAQADAKSTLNNDQYQAQQQQYSDQLQQNQAAQQQHQDQTAP